jgi:hypothetical protein
MTEQDKIAAAEPPLECVVRPEQNLYLISRTSAYSEDKPCPDAFKILVINTDTRSCDDPKKIPANKGTDGDWYTRGTNHRIEGGKIKRDLGYATEWAVNVIDLPAFIEEYGTCVISKNNDGFCAIEIYDDYRE